MALNWKPAAALIFGVVAISACNMADSAEATIDADVAGSGKKGWSSSWSGEPFDRITLAGPDNLTFVTEGRHAVTATGDAKALEELQFKVKDGELHIRRKSRWGFGDSGEATITVNAPALRGLSLAGSGAARVDRMDGDTVELSIAGSGNAEIAELVARSVEGAIAGSGSILVAGRADTSDISIAGSGSIKGEGFASKVIEISIAGSGDVIMASDGEVDASLMGSGDVTIKGKAKCTSSTMGSGTITCG